MSGYQVHVGRVNWYRMYHQYATRTSVRSDLINQMNTMRVEEIDNHHFVLILVRREEEMKWQ